MGLPCRGHAAASAHRAPRSAPSRERRDRRRLRPERPGLRRRARARGRDGHGARGGRDDRRRHADERADRAGPAPRPLLRGPPDGGRVAVPELARARPARARVVLARGRPRPSARRRQRRGDVALARPDRRGTRRGRRRLAASVRALGGCLGTCSPTTSSSRSCISPSTRFASCASACPRRCRPPCSRERWKGPQARALFGGVAAHAFSPLGGLMSSSVGVALITACHAYGWPVARGGSRSITDALASFVTENGGTIETGVRVTSLSELPAAEVVALDLAPGRGRRDRRRQAARRASRAPTAATGTGPAPSRSTSRWRAGCRGRTRRAGGRGPSTPPARSRRSSPPSATSTAAGCPSGRSCSSPSSTSPIRAARRATSIRSGPTPTCRAATTATPTEALLDQIERFAPGLRERIVASAVRPASDFAAYNANYVGGDIITGANTPVQVLFRPRFALDPYATGIPGVYICSAATPPGAGAHGMNGYNAARSALKMVGACLVWPPPGACRCRDPRGRTPALRASATRRPAARR